MTRVFIALGSNLGDRMANLEAAIAALAPDVEVTARSPVYETDPQYVTDQPEFLNMAVAGETALEPVALLARLKEIETALGRTATVRFGPRVIDLDIALFGDRVVDTPDLTIPHPRIAERVFVLRPLADIAPDILHPVSGLSLAAMLAALEDKSGIRLYGG